MEGVAAKYNTKDQDQYSNIFEALEEEVNAYTCVRKLLERSAERNSLFLNYKSTVAAILWL